MARFKMPDYSSVSVNISGGGGGVGRAPAPRGRGGGARKMAVQAPVSGQEGWFSCSLHEIHYRTVAGGCPVCRAEAEKRPLMDQIVELKNAIKLLRQDKAALEARVSHVAAMRAALDVISEEDRLAIKELLYRWQRGHGLEVALRKVRFQSPNGMGVRHEVSGLKAGDEEHHCDSVGGVAIARAVSELTKLMGRDEAARQVAKVFAPTLAPMPPEEKC